MRLPCAYSLVAWWRKAVCDTRAGITRFVSGNGTAWETDMARRNLMERRPKEERPARPGARATAVHIATLPNLNRIWESVLSLARETRYPKGHHLVMDDGERQDFFYLGEGRLAMLHCTPNGRARDMLHLEAGNLFNIASVLGNTLVPYRNPGTQYDCLEPARIWRFPGALLGDEAFIRAHPPLIVNLMASLGVRVFTLHETVSGVGTCGSLARLCGFILALSAANGNALSFRPGLSQAQLAPLLGIHRVTLARTLARLRATGAVLEFTRERAVIGNPAILREWAGR